MPPTEVPSADPFATGTRDASLETALDAPLQIVVTAAARENLALRSLLRQAVPLLRHPDRFPALHRQQLALALEEALKTDCPPGDPYRDELPEPPEDGEEDNATPPDYEPGCEPEWKGEAEW